VAAEQRRRLEHLVQVHLLALRSRELEGERGLFVAIDPGAPEHEDFGAAHDPSSFLVSGGRHAASSASFPRRTRRSPRTPVPSSTGSTVVSPIAAIGSPANRRSSSCARLGSTSTRKRVRLSENASSTSFSAPPSAGTRRRSSLAPNPPASA